MGYDEAEKLIHIKEFTKKVLQSDKTGHDMTHIERVLAMTQHILVTEPTANAFVAQAAALLHDTYDDKLFDDVELAKARVIKLLTDIAVPAEQQVDIFNIIDNMSWSKQRFGKPVRLSLAGKIVQDADRLDAIGAIAIARAIQFGAIKGDPLYDPAMPPRRIATKAAYRKGEGNTVINHFYEKLFLLKDYLNTLEGQRIGIERDRIMHDFVNQFEKEWQQKDY